MVVSNHVLFPPPAKMIQFDKHIFFEWVEPPTTLGFLTLPCAFAESFPLLRFFSFNRCHKLQFSSECMWKGTGVADGHLHLQEIYGLSAKKFFLNFFFFNKRNWVTKCNIFLKGKYASTKWYHWLWISLSYVVFLWSPYLRCFSSKSRKKKDCVKNQWS